MRKYIFIFLACNLLIAASAEIYEPDFKLDFMRRSELSELNDDELVEIILFTEREQRRAVRRIRRYERRDNRKGNIITRLRRRAGFANGVLITAGIFILLIIVIVGFKIYLRVKTGI